MERQAQKPRCGADAGRAVAGIRLQREEAALASEPALAQVGQHAHGLDGFRVPEIARRVGAGRVSGFGGGVEERGGQALVEVGKTEQGERGNDCEYAQPGAQQEDHQDMDRRPWGVEESEQALAREELPDIGEIAQTLAGIAATRTQVALEGRVKQARPELQVKRHAGADQRFGAHQLERGFEHVKSHHDERQHEQRDLVAARKHAVVDLQHVDRRDEKQQVDGEAEGPDCVENAPEPADYLP